MSSSHHNIDAPPHAMFRVLIRWGRFVFEPHAAPASTSGNNNHNNDHHGGSNKLGGNNNNAEMMSSVEQATGTEYRLVWFRAIDGVAIGHTKWCSLTLLHSVVSVVDFQSAPAVVDIASGYMSNTATRVILLQLQQRSVDPSLDPTLVIRNHHNDNSAGDRATTTRQASSPPVVAATGAVDIGAFVGSPPRSYIVTLEASFFAVGKLHMNLVVKEPKLDDGLAALEDNNIKNNNIKSGKIGGGGGDAIGDLPLGQQSSPTALLQQKQAQLRKQQRRNLERLTVLVVDSVEGERADGGSSKKLGVYGIARLLQDHATEDNRFPLPAESVYQLKVSFVQDPKYVAKPMLARQHTTAANVGSSVGGSNNTQNNNNNNYDTTTNNNTPSQNLFNRAPARDNLHHHSSNNNTTTSITNPLGQAGDQVYDDDDMHSHNRRVVTFRTMLQKPHDGRVLWRCGIAMSPCTKIKFALYRDQNRIGSTAIMSSQLAVAKMPHDFCLPIKVRHTSGNSVQVHSLQINLTLAEHTLDTVSSEVISSYLNSTSNNDNNNNEDQHVSASANSSSNVCLVPGSDIMVLLRGYEVPQEEKNLDEYLKAHPEALPFSKDDDDEDDDSNNSNDADGELKELLAMEHPSSSVTTTRNTRARSASSKGRSRSNTNTNTPTAQQPRQHGTTTSTATNNNSRNNSPPLSARSGSNNNNTNNNNERFSSVAPVVFPQELRSSLDPQHTKGFVEVNNNSSNYEGNNNNGGIDPAVIAPLKSENNRLSAENSALRTALQEQEERIRDQESYILTLLENQGVVAVDDDEDDYFENNNNNDDDTNNNNNNHPYGGVQDDDDDEEETVLYVNKTPR